MVPLRAVVNQFGNLPFDWRQWFARADDVVEACRRVGPTASRPIDGFVGMQYFDTDLGHVIWAAAIVPAALPADRVTWVDATGTTV